MGERQERKGYKGMEEGADEGMLKTSTGWDDSNRHRRVDRKDKVEQCWVKPLGEARRRLRSGSLRQKER